jgi:hypothetical protein
MATLFTLLVSDASAGSTVAIFGIAYYIVGIISYVFGLRKGIRPYLAKTFASKAWRVFLIIVSAVAFFLLLTFGFIKIVTAEFVAGQTQIVEITTVDSSSVVKGYLSEKHDFFRNIALTRFSADELDMLKDLYAGTSPKKIESIHGFSIPKQKEIKQRFDRFIESFGFFRGSNNIFFSRGPWG